MIAKELAWQMQRLNIDPMNGPPLVEVVKAQAERAKTLHEMADKSRYFFGEIEYNPDALKKHITPDILPAVTALREGFADLVEWKQELIHQVIVATAEKLNLKLGKIAQPLRIAVTGDTVSPPIDITLLLLGHAKTLTRLDNFLKKIKNSHDF